MNAKRQTIWLVSMLSLMVVLSAYYLFSEDLGHVDNALDAQSELDMTSTQSGDIADLDGAVPSTDELGTADEQVLNQLQNQGISGNDYIVAMQMQQHSDSAEQTEQLLNIITTTDNSETMEKAYADLRGIEERDAKVTNLQELLLQDYQNAVVTEAGSKWKVVVHADQLEKSQAVSILELAAKELSVPFYQIEVQYVQ